MKIDIDLSVDIDDSVAAGCPDQFRKEIALLLIKVADDIVNYRDVDYNKIELLRKVVGSINVN